jgi:hypothetical protein
VGKRVGLRLEIAEERIPSHPPILADRDSGVRCG